MNEGAEDNLKDVLNVKGIAGLTDTGMTAITDGAGSFYENFSMDKIMGIL
ncbi:MAG: hypothetical protein IIC12_07545 [Proteobacteria bacterium]|nr:hypothetical protein [Pseudomonadota bacterium]